MTLEDLIMGEYSEKFRQLISLVGREWWKLVEKVNHFVLLVLKQSFVLSKYRISFLWFL